MALTNDISTAVANFEKRAPLRRRRRGVSFNLTRALLAGTRSPSRTSWARERESRVLSVEMELGGMAVEFKARGLRGLVTWAAIDLTLAAVVQELMKPRQFRTWHGHVAGVVPYDFRKPTVRRVVHALWDPDNSRLFGDTVFGVGWSLNLAQLPRVLLGAARTVKKDYVAPSTDPTLSA